VHSKQCSEFPVRIKGANEVHLVPYSEHSNFAELLEFVKFLRPKKLIPTVGVDGDDSEKAKASMMKHFRNLIDEQANKVSCKDTFCVCEQAQQWACHGSVRQQSCHANPQAELC
jgi:Cft2 family RNA processing exonuclease